jgi:hypothetical protein
MFRTHLRLCPSHAFLFRLAADNFSELLLDIRKPLPLLSSELADSTRTYAIFAQLFHSGS